MPDWTALRNRARQWHDRLRAGCPPFDAPLPPADLLLAAAEAETGLARVGLSPGDPLLFGAQAVLDRDSECIWYAQEGVSPARQRFAQAHEFGHYREHGPDADAPPGFCQADDAPEAFLPVEQRAYSAQFAAGYSPAERRETEANVFAGEFLLPAPHLYRAFVEFRWDAATIAAYVGLSESCVLAQLAHALLLPRSAHLTLASDSPAVSELAVGPEATAVFGASPAPTFVPTPISGSVPPENAPDLWLDDSQTRAAHVARGPVLIDAGPGTGKTRALAARACFLLTERQVAPENLLALTFSNRAAEEMRTRLRARLDARADRVWIGTFHAFGYEILRKDGAQIGLPLAPRLVEIVEAVALLERHLDRLPLDAFENLPHPTVHFPTLLRCIARAKDALKTPADYLAGAERQAEDARDEKEKLAARRSLEIARVYAIYQELLEANGLLDFGDLIMRAVELLDACPDVRARWQALYPHLLADEYQDINRASARLLQRLVGDGAGFWAVGDWRQSIYRFRGASPANVRNWERDFPGGRRLRLERNYRSRPPLVTLFQHLAAQIPDATAGQDGPTEWTAQRVSNSLPAVTVAIADDEVAQADGLAASVRAWKARGFTPGAQAILCRTNRQAALLSGQLEARGIPTRHVGDLFARPEVKDLLAVLSLACEPTGSALVRVARLPEYAVPADDITLLLQAAQEANQLFPGALALARTLPGVSQPGQRGLLRLHAHITPLVHHGDAWRLLARYLFQASDYLRPLLADDRSANWQRRVAIYQLLQFAQGLVPPENAADAREAQAAPLRQIRALMACGAGQSPRLDASLDDSDAVTLLTVHRAKGLEFPIVYVPNLIEGEFPHKERAEQSVPPGLLEEDEEDEAGGNRVGPIETGSQTGAAEANAKRKSQDADMQEDGESYLFFVALSRAREHLVLSRPAARRGKPLPPSRLLAALAPALQASGAQFVEWKQEAGRTTAPPDLQTGEPGTETANEADDAVLNAAGEISEPDAAGLAEDVAADKPTVALHALEEYQRCPRQYYYAQVLALPETDGDSAYLAFHDSVQRTLRWLETERAGGNAPTLEAALAQTAAFRQARASDEDASAHQRVLRERARALITQVYRQFDLSASSAATTSDAREFAANLPNGRVTLRADVVETLPDQTLRLRRRHLRRAESDDHTAPRLALLRQAAQQENPARSVQIVLDYPAEGSARDVPESKRYEPARVEKYDAALRGIRLNHFPAAPEERKCAACPYLFVCPT